MIPDRFASLKRGDIVRHKLSGEAMVVADRLGSNTLILVRTTIASNSDEWLSPEEIGATEKAPI